MKEVLYPCCEHCGQCVSYSDYHDYACDEPGCPGARPTVVDVKDDAS